MNQEILNQIKLYLNEFPHFMKGLLKDPFGHVDREVSMDLIKAVLFSFLVEALTNTLYTIAILNIGGIATSLIFSPVQVLVIIAFISFLIWFVLDKAGFARVDFLAIFKVIVIAEMLISIVALPIMIALAYIKSVDLIYIASALLILAKAYIVYRGFTKQLQLSDKRAFSIVGVFTVIFLAPIVTSFFDGYSMRKQIRDNKKLHEMQMEQSIEELEKELGGGD